MSTEGGIKAIAKRMAALSPKDRDWLDELKSYGRILISTTLAFVFFRFMKAIGMDAWYVETLEKMDEVTTVVVVGCYLLTLVRQAVAGVFAQ